MGGNGVLGQVGVCVNVPGMLDVVGVIGQSSVGGADGASEGVRVCRKIEPENVAGTLDSSNPTLVCTGIKQSCCN